MPDPILTIRDLSKTYRVWDHPLARLKAPVLEAAARRLPEGSGVGERFRRKARGYYQDFHALHPISFEIPPATSFGILGRNGSGKSTLLQMIAGTLTPTGGAVEVRGRVAALLELGSGFNPEFTGRENVYMNASILGIPRRMVDERFDDIAAFADIGEYMDQPVKTYSSGMYVRLAFSVITHVDADVLIVDEALAVGDVFFVQKCMRFLRRFQEQGVLLFVSHDLSSINRLCDQALWLDNGSLRMRGSPKEVTEAYFTEYYAGGANGSGFGTREDREAAFGEPEEGEGAEKEGSSAAPARAARAAPTTTSRSAPLDPEQVLGEAVADQRLPFLNYTEHRNDIEVFRFDPLGDSFGARRAEVVDARLVDAEGRRLVWIVGGEKVTALVTAEARERIEAPILGFALKDSTGQVLFGDNTFLTTRGRPLSVKKGRRLTARFHFQMPILRPGQYVMNATVATGTQTEHEMQHWIHDALVLHSYTKSDTTGLVGIPMIGIEVE